MENIDANRSVAKVTRCEEVGGAMGTNDSRRDLGWRAFYVVDITLFPVGLQANTGLAIPWRRHAFEQPGGTSKRLLVIIGDCI